MWLMWLLMWRRFGGGSCRGLLVLFDRQGRRDGRGGRDGRGDRRRHHGRGAAAHVGVGARRQRAIERRMHGRNVEAVGGDQRVERDGVAARQLARRRAGADRGRRQQCRRVGRHQRLEARGIGQPAEAIGLGANG